MIWKRWFGSGEKEFESTMNLPKDEEDLILKDIDTLQVMIQTLASIEGRNVAGLPAQAHRDIGTCIDLWKKEWGDMNFFCGKEIGPPHCTLVDLMCCRNALEKLYAKQLRGMCIGMASTESDDPPVKPDISVDEDRMNFELHIPFTDPNYPVRIGVDYFGPNPRMQLLIYGVGDEEDCVAVQFDQLGKPVAVEISNPAIITRIATSRDGNEAEIRQRSGVGFQFTVAQAVIHLDRDPAPISEWRKERDAPFTP